ncbi:NUDIX domain-containing protein [Streptomyces sp. NPDC051909]|uniref:NUDIX domain-containing protein n=1 Tax=Streptomyces sp. NPDC051909 TaxID=3154944 RepID=UPI0034340517
MTMTDEEYGALRASAALWAGTSVLITNRFGEVLIQRVDYLETCLLPGGGVDPGESPARAAARELMEELGVDVVVERGLAVDWVSGGGVAGARFGDLVPLGHLSGPDGPGARVRCAAALTELGPAQSDPATGAAYVRVLATPEQALELFDWGAPAAEQLAALHRAREGLGIPRAARQAVTEVGGSQPWPDGAISARTSM